MRNVLSSMENLSPYSEQLCSCYIKTINYIGLHVLQENDCFACRYLFRHFDPCEIRKQIWIKAEVCYEEITL